MQGCLDHPSADRDTSLLGDLKLHRALRFLLENHRALCHTITVGDVPYAHFDQIAGSQLAVDGEIKQREIAGRAAKLEADADRPDIAKPEGCFLTYEFAFVPRLATNR